MGADVLLFTCTNDCCYAQTTEKVLEKYVAARYSVYLGVTQQMSATAAGIFYEVHNYYSCSLEPSFAEQRLPAKPMACQAGKAGI